MSITRSMRGIRAGLAVLALAIAGPLAAQNGDDTPIVEIEKIEATAAKHLTDGGNWHRAASLFRRAAELRPAGDETAVEDLLRAGRLSFYQGHERQAVRDFESAGVRALDRGDVIVAANAFADAAWVAESNGQPAEANELLRRAQMLANSPLLGDHARDMLKTRWEVTGIQP